jgi:hypothetical protein
MRVGALTATCLVCVRTSVAWGKLTSIQNAHSLLADKVMVLYDGAEMKQLHRGRPKRKPRTGSYGAASGMG